MALYIVIINSLVDFLRNIFSINKSSIFQYITIFCWEYSSVSTFIYSYFNAFNYVSVSLFLSSEMYSRFYPVNSWHLISNICDLCHFIHVHILWFYSIIFIFIILIILMIFFHVCIYFPNSLYPKTILFRYKNIFFLFFMYIFIICVLW